MAVSLAGGVVLCAKVHGLDVGVDDHGLDHRDGHLKQRSQLRSSGVMADYLHTQAWKAAEGDNRDEDMT